MFFHGSPFFSLDNVHLPPLAVCVSCMLSWADLSCGCAAVSSIHPKITCKLERIWMPHVRSFKRSWDQFLVFYTLHSVILLLLGPKEAWFEDIKKLHSHAALPALWNYRNNYCTSKGVESQLCIPQLYLSSPTLAASTYSILVLVVLCSLVFALLGLWLNNSLLTFLPERNKQNFKEK